jgi:ABC-type transport system substrate-binding protein
LKIAIERDVENFEPQKNYGTSTPLFQGHIYETLLGYDQSGRVIGVLAESWTQPDPLSWVFKLRHGVKFHDGQPFTADDVVYSFNRLLNPATGATRTAQLSVIHDVAATDESTVVMHLKQPFGTLPLVLTLNDVAILKRGWSEAGHDYNQATNGTGPFKLARYERNVVYRLERNTEYWRDDLPYLDAIEIVPIGDTPTRINSLLSGDVDFATLIPWENLEQIQEEKALAIVKTFDSFMLLRLSTKQKPFDDPRVRQALNYAIDRDAISAFAWGGGAQPMDAAFIRPDSMWYTPPATKWSYDPKKATALLAEAGLKPADVKFTLFSISFVHLPTSEVVVNQLKKFGMDVTLQTIENAVLFQKRGTGEYQAMMDGGSNPFADPDFYALWFASDGSNFAKGAGFSDPKLDSMLQATRAEQDFDKRKAMIRTEEDQILTDAPIGFLVWRPQVEAFSTKVKNYTRVPGFGSDSPIYLRFDQVWLD